MIGETGFAPTHEKIKQFECHYCCFSKCSLISNYTGYGSVMFIFSKFIDILYCSTLDCPSEGKTYGAQIDLKSDSIRTSYINLTNGNAVYCCGIEYRDAISGYFKYQTLCQLEGSFLTSFTSINDIFVSYCNYVNDTINPVQNGALIYTIRSNIDISHFCFVDISIFGVFEFVYFAMSIGKVVLSDSLIDNNLLAYLDNATTNNVKIYDENSDKFTNTIYFVDLGECKGEQIPPPIIPGTKFFSNSYQFSNSKLFTHSSTFSKTNLFSASLTFSESLIFLDTGKFSKSNKFSNSQKFTGSNKFTDSNLFSKSPKFSCSNKFNESQKFSKPNKFTDSNEFTQSQMFSESNKLINSNELSKKSFEFSSSKIFSESFEYLPLDKRIQSNCFQMTDTFTNSFPFTPTNVFTRSNYFTSLHSFTSNQKEVTFHKSYSLTHVNIKTVVFSLSQVGSYSNFLSYCPEMETFLHSISYSEFHKNFPYVILSLSPSFVPSYFAVEIARSSKISPEKLIGITCGSTAGFFIILSIIFLVFQKRQRIDELSLPSTDSDEISGDDTQKTKEFEGLTLSPNLVPNDDTWLYN